MLFHQWNQEWKKEEEAADEEKKKGIGIFVPLFEAAVASAVVVAATASVVASFVGVAASCPSLLHCCMYANTFRYLD